MTIARHFTPHVYGFHRTVGKGNAWLFMASATRSKNILFLEEDFGLIERKDVALARLRAAADLLEGANSVNAVRWCPGWLPRGFHSQPP